jgi:hypothetical protein
MWFRVFLCSDLVNSVCVNYACDVSFRILILIQQEIRAALHRIYSMYDQRRGVRISEDFVSSFILGAYIFCPMCLNRIGAVNKWL